MTNRVCGIVTATWKEVQVAGWLSFEERFLVKKYHMVDNRLAPHV